MTKKDCRKKLKLHGYEVKETMNGHVVAKKGQRTYMADSLNAMIKKLF